MIRTLDALDPRFRPLAVEFLARCVEADLCVRIINTLRTAAEQAVLVASGHSWVQHSLHEDGLAMDICPYDVFALHGADKLAWDVNDPVWAIVAGLAEHTGLVSGYRWIVKDAGHVQFPTDAHPLPARAA